MRTSSARYTCTYTRPGRAPVARCRLLGRFCCRVPIEYACAWNSTGMSRTRVPWCSSTHSFSPCQNSALAVSSTIAVCTTGRTIVASHSPGLHASPGRPRADGQHLRWDADAFASQDAGRAITPARKTRLCVRVWFVVLGLELPVQPRLRAAPLDDGLELGWRISFFSFFNPFINYPCLFTFFLRCSVHDVCRLALPIVLTVSTTTGSTDLLLASQRLCAGPNSLENEREQSYCYRLHRCNRVRIAESRDVERARALLVTVSVWCRGQVGAPVCRRRSLCETALRVLGRAGRVVDEVGLGVGIFLL